MWEHWGTKSGSEKSNFVAVQVEMHLKMIFVTRNVTLNDVVMMVEIVSMKWYEYTYTLYNTSVCIFVTFWKDKS